MIRSTVLLLLLFTLSFECESKSITNENILVLNETVVNYHTKRTYDAGQSMFIKLLVEY